MMKKIVCIFMLALGLTTTGKSQNILNSQGLTSMDKGKEAMLDGDYQRADQLFKDAMQKIEKLPTELAYFFGRNSYHINKHRQAIKWLNKYIEIKGTTGQYSDQAIKYLELANTSYIEVRSEEIDNTIIELNQESRIACPGDRVLCPVCKGSGVVITQGTFDAKYQTCPYSGIEGILTCDEYNLFLKGQLDPKEETKE